MERPLTLGIGEILWDILPDGKTLGGAPANVAWHLSQLGADARVVSAVGDDDLGKEILDRLGQMRLDAGCVAVLPGVPTSTVEASLDAQGNATYVIHDNVAWDALPVTETVLDLAARAKAVNFGSLSQRNAAGRDAAHAILDAVDPDAVKVFDVNLRPPFIDRGVLDLGLARASVVKMNHDELPVIARLFDWTDNPEHALLQLVEAYPNVRHVVVTRAEHGAWWQTRDALHKSAPPKAGGIVDTIGAGDSVTAACIMGLLAGKDAPAILDAAMRLASFVCGQRGGMPELPPALRALFSS